MSVKLRLKRMGRKKLPYFRVIAIDSRRARDGLELDRLGVYNPLADEGGFRVDEEKLFQWLENGAQPSDTVRNLMKDHGLALKWHLRSQGKSEEEIEREFQKWQLLRESKADARAEQERRETGQREQVEEEEVVEAGAEEPESEEESPAETEEPVTEDETPVEEPDEDDSVDEEREEEVQDEPEEEKPSEEGDDEAEEAAEQTEEQTPDEEPEDEEKDQS